MTNKKTTRRALVTSIISLLLCLSMLVGTTFAWFTDSVTSGVNKIVAGNLDVELYHTNAKVENESVAGNTALFRDENGDQILWEPGVVVYENLTVANEGTLALKYQLSVNFENATATAEGKTLADVLKVAFIPGGVDTTLSREALVASVTEWGEMKSFVQNGQLLPGEAAPTTDVYGIVIYWEPSANDNDYNMNNENQGKVLSIDLGVSLFATQLEAETDSFGPDYDKEAGEFSIYTFDNASDLNAFDPDNYTNNDNVDGAGMSVEGGKAVINTKGAFFSKDVNLNTSVYTIEYDVDVSAMAEGDTINLETGDTATWSGSNYITIKKGSAIVSIGPAANNPTGYVDNVTMGEQLHFTHTYSMNAEGKWVTTTTVTDGTNTYNASKTVDSAAVNTVYWDVYDLSENAGGKVTLDNFSVQESAATVDNAAKLEAVLAKGGTVKLTTNIAAAETIEIPEGVTVTLDLNGHTVSASVPKNEGHVINNSGNLTLVGGAVKSTADNGGSAIYNAGTLTIEGTAITGAPQAGEGWPSYAINNYGDMTISGAVITSTHGAVSCGGGETVLEDTQITMNGFGGSSHVFYVGGTGTKVTVESGTYTHNGNVDGSLAYIMTGTEMIINGGSFSASNGGYGLAAYNGSLTINGGTFANGLLDWGGPISITGGAFASDVSKYVAEGYKASKGGNTWIVVPETAAVAADSTALAEAAKTANATVYLTAGTYEFPTIAEGVTIIGTEGVVFNDTLSGELKNTTFKNITISASNAQRWAYSHGTLVFENCTFDATGVYAIHYDGLNGANITYKNCTINGWVAIGGGAEHVTFDGCSINGNGTFGVIRLYSEGTIKNCTFDVANVNTTDIYQDGIHAVDCEIKVSNNTNVNGEMSALYNISGTGKITEE